MTMLLRDDDVFLTESPTNGRVLYNFALFKEVHEFIAKHGKKHMLAIIASEIANYPELTEYILSRKSEFEFGIHGWKHQHYETWKENEIYVSLKRAKDLVEKVFNTKVEWYFPPWNKRTDEVYRACTRLGVKLNDNWVNAAEVLNGKKADALCFHFWDKEVAQLKQCLEQNLI